MNKIKSILGYVWAALMVPVLLVSFLGMNQWAQVLVDMTGVEISPWFTGGEVAFVEDRGDYRMEVHEPVFMALIGERKEGFVQVAWTPVAGLPAMIEEDVDVDADGAADLKVRLDTQILEVDYTGLNDLVLGVDGPYRLGDGLGVRVLVSNPER